MIKVRGRGEREGGREVRLRQGRERGESLKLLRVDLMHSENVCENVCVCVCACESEFKQGDGKIIVGHSVEV